MYAKCGMLDRAQTVFDRLTVHDVISWNALLAGYSHNGYGHKELSLTFTCSLKACGIVGDGDKGTAINDRVRKLGLIENNIILGNALVDMYAKCGLLQDAHKTLKGLRVKDIVSWNALIAGYAEHGPAQEGLKPDAVTFPCLLSACSHAKLVAKGKEMFELMPTVHGIRPSLDHYNCMIDILSRAGRIKEALRFIESMPCLPSIDMWTAILSACKVHAEIDLGFQCFQQLVRTDSGWAVPHVLMWNIYNKTRRRSIFK
ncbi:hypothetical protein KP509_06G014800 [Ceratopteris richardii]|uniref:Pentatricopeptide repeat-containing protein n=1 Tax=Ceratopteris richardii TaxID=49495 RepID=A0A8T2UIM3_CERRI|nr:hypothetical protein KP509_06G014800 [Ceratopteris richardii]